MSFFCIIFIQFVASILHCTCIDVYSYLFIHLFIYLFNRFIYFIYLFIHPKFFFLTANVTLQSQLLDIATSKLFLFFPLKMTNFSQFSTSLIFLLCICFGFRLQFNGKTKKLINIARVDQIKLVKNKLGTISSLQLLENFLTASFSLLDGG